MRPLEAILTRRGLPAALLAAGSVSVWSEEPRNSVLLADGTSFPLVSFGVQIYDDATARELTLQASNAGFRSFFASIESGNQRGFAEAIGASGLPRDQLYLTGSVLSDDADTFRTAYAQTATGVDKNIAAFREGGEIEQLDMLLLEYPASNREAVRGQWRALEDAQQAGRVRSLGVANFSPEQLDFILSDPKAKLRPQLNQISYSPAYRNPYAQIRRAHRERGILLQAWGPLGGPTWGLGGATLAELAAIGEECGRRSAQQVALRWIVQRGVAVCVHSRKLEHLQDDLKLFDWRLSEAQLERVDRLCS